MQSVLHFILGRIEYYLATQRGQYAHPDERRSLARGRERETQYRIHAANTLMAWVRLLQWKGRDPHKLCGLLYVTELRLTVSFPDLCLSD